MEAAIHPGGRLPQLVRHTTRQPANRSDIPNSFLAAQAMSESTYQRHQDIRISRAMFRTQYQ